MSEEDVSAGPAVHTVLVVDDDGDLRTMLRLALRVTPSLKLVGEAADGATALNLAAQLRPDVVILDLGLPDIEGHEVLTRLRGTVNDVRVVVYTGAEYDARTRALRGGAADVISKSDDLRSLLAALTGVFSRTANMREVTLPATPSSPKAARILLTDLCDEWDCGVALDAALLVVTELVTNAIVHAGSDCVLRVMRRGGVLRLEVDDSGVGTPDLQTSSDADEHGRGLYLVSAVALSWGITPTPSGKTVWAELSV